MSTLNEQFEQAVADSKNLPERPDNMTMLKLYALYKQGSTRRRRRQAPGLHRHGRPREVGRLERAEGPDRRRGQQAYIDLVEDLK